MCNPALALGLQVGGQLIQGVMGMNAANQQAAAVAEQRETEKKLYATKDQRTRRQFRSQIGRQVAEIAASGLSLSSPTALLLARDAAEEMSFESQSVRSHGEARSAELTATERNLRAQGREAMFGGITGAAGSFFKAAPTIWPGLMA